MIAVTTLSLFAGLMAFSRRRASSPGVSRGTHTVSCVLRHVLDFIVIAFDFY